MPKKIEKDWRPEADFPTLRYRAEVLTEIRRYFSETGALEVTTPLLMPYGTTDPALNSFVAEPHARVSAAAAGYLQTSPEFAMKRLLAAGSGDIFQVCPAFRAEETGRHHLTEFTMLEWYRLGYDHHRMMDDVEALVKRVLPAIGFTRRSYAAWFHDLTGLDPHDASDAVLAEAVRHAGIELGTRQPDRFTSLDALFAHAALRRDELHGAVFVYDFPVEHAAYARLSRESPKVAQRFELLIDGIEIANGYHELTERAEQESRQLRENDRRRRADLPRVAIDPLFLAALEAGLPPCAGVALGIDRLVMLGSGLSDVHATTSFSPYP